MKTLKRILLESLLEYFRGNRSTGLCFFMKCEDDSLQLFKLMMCYAEKWEHSIRIGIDNFVSNYFIPCSVGNDSIFDAADEYDRRSFSATLQNQPMRREFANFVMKSICREMKIKIVQLPEIN